MIPHLMRGLAAALALCCASPSAPADPLSNYRAIVNSMIGPNGQNAITGGKLNATLNALLPIFASMGSFDANGQFRLLPSAVPGALGSFDANGAFHLLPSAIPASMGSFDSGGQFRLLPIALPGSGYLDFQFGSTLGLILCRSSSGWIGVAPKAAGQVLTSNGTSACPDYAPPATAVTAADLTNLFTNSQFQILAKDLVLNNKIGPNSIVTLPACQVTSTNTNSTPVIFVTTPTSCPTLRPNDLLFATGGLADGFRINSSGQSTLLRALSVASDHTNFYATPARGFAPSASTSGIAQPADMADLTGTVGDWAMYWIKSSSLVFWPDDWDVDIEPGCMRAGGFYKNNIGDEQVIGQSIQPQAMARMRGQTVTMTMRVKQAVKGGSGTSRAFVKVDGVVTYGIPVAGSGAYEDVRVTVTIPATAQNIFSGVAFNGAATDRYYVCEPHLAVAPALPPHFFAPPRNEYLIPDNTLNPASYIGASMTLPASADGTGVYYSTPIDFYGETQGWVHYSVPEVTINSEFASNNVAGIGSPVAYRNILGVSAAGTNIVYGPDSYATIAGKISTTNGRLMLSDGLHGTPIGWGVVYTIVPSLAVTNLSIDIVGYKLSN